MSNKLESFHHQTPFIQLSNKNSKHPIHDDSTIKPNDATGTINTRACLLQKKKCATVWHCSSRNHLHTPKVWKSVQSTRDRRAHFPTSTCSPTCVVLHMFHNGLHYKIFFFRVSLTWPRPVIDCRNLIGLFLVFLMHQSMDRNRHVSFEWTPLDDGRKKSDSHRRKT